MAEQVENSVGQDQATGHLAWVDSDEGSDWSIQSVDTDKGVMLYVEDSNCFDGPTLRSRASALRFLADVEKAVDQVWPTVALVGNRPKVVAKKESAPPEGEAR